MTATPVTVSLALEESCYAIVVSVEAFEIPAACRNAASCALKALTAVDGAAVTGLIVELTAVLAEAAVVVLDADDLSPSPPPP